MIHMTGDLIRKMDLDELLTELANAPASEIDASITLRIQHLVGLPPDAVAARMRLILDECARASLASDFAMMAMNVARREAQSRGLLSINC